MVVPPEEGECETLDVSLVLSTFPPFPPYLITIIAIRDTSHAPTQFRRPNPERSELRIFNGTKHT